MDPPRQLSIEVTSSSSEDERANAQNVGLALDEESDVLGRDDVLEVGHAVAEAVFRVVAFDGVGRADGVVHHVCG